MTIKTQYGSGSSKDIIMIIAFLFGIIIVFYMLAKREIGSLGESIAGAVPKISLPGLPDFSGKQFTPVTAVAPKLSPVLFPTTSVGENIYSIMPTAQQSQPYVDYLSGAMRSGTEAKAILLTPEQEASFLDPVGDAQFAERQKSVVEKPIWQFW